MIKRIGISLLSVFLMSTACFAQDELTPASDSPQGEAEAESKNEVGAEVSAAWQLVSMTESLVIEVQGHAGDCEAMKGALIEALKRNEAFMKSLDYATEQADEAAINRIHESAVKLGTLLGACYDDQELQSILSYQLKK